MNLGRFLSSYLRAVDVKAPITVTISSVVAEEVGRDSDQQTKPVVYFKEIDQGAVLNKTSLTALIELLGDDSDKWVGKQVVMYNDPNVLYAGKRVGGIRFRAV